MPIARWQLQQYLFKLEKNPIRLNSVKKGLS